jgi:hypothetical protein
MELLFIFHYLRLFRLPVEDLHLTRNHLSEIAHLIVNLIAVSLQSPLEEDQSALDKILLANLSRFPHASTNQSVTSLDSLSALRQHQLTAILNEQTVLPLGV